MPNDPYPGATFMSPSHPATLFVFLPLCLNLTALLMVSNPQPPFLDTHLLTLSHFFVRILSLPYPSIHLLCPPCIHIHFQPTPSIIPPLLFQPGSSPHPFLFVTFMCGLRLHADFWVSPTYLAPPHFLF